MEEQRQSLVSAVTFLGIDLGTLDFAPTSYAIFSKSVALPRSVAGPLANPLPQVSGKADGFLLPAPETLCLGPSVAAGGGFAASQAGQRY